MNTKAKNKPIPVRLDDAESQNVTDLSAKTGMPKSEVLRRACRFSLPKFLSGEVDISRVTPTATEPAA